MVQTKKCPNCKQHIELTYSYGKARCKHCLYPLTKGDSE